MKPTPLRSRTALTAALLAGLAMAWLPGCGAAPGAARAARDKS